MTKILILVVIVFAVLAVVAALATKLGSGAAAKADVYFLRKSLFTPAERSFLGVLEPNLPPDVRVFGKVRLEDIFGVRKGLDRRHHVTARNRINRKHVDFLLVRTTDLSPLAGIELDDSSHEEDDRMQRDAFVDEVFAGAGLPLLHVPAQKNYSPGEITQKVLAILATRRPT